jgi:hypothetical protein
MMVIDNGREVEIVYVKRYRSRGQNPIHFAWGKRKKAEKPAYSHQNTGFPKQQTAKEEKSIKQKAFQHKNTQSRRFEEEQNRKRPSFQRVQSSR